MHFDTLGWLDEAIEIDYLNKSFSRNGYKPTHVVLHGTAGGTRAEDIANYFATSAVESSSHFIIGQDGHIVQGVNCDAAAWANGPLIQPRIPFPPDVNGNYYTISIEHCKPSSDNSDALTDAQKLASFQLVKAICEHYNIPKRRGDVNGGIVSHADFDSVNRARCPGPYHWDELIAYINAGGTNVAEDTFNQMVIDLWSSQRDYFNAIGIHAIGKSLPPRDTGIFNSWRQEMIAGRYRGVPLSQEYQTVDAKGVKVAAQNFAGGTCHWYAPNTAVWL